MPGDFIRKTADDSEEGREAVITIDLASASGKEKYTITTTIKTRPAVGFEWVVTETKNDGDILDEHEFPWQNIFVAGYGAGLRTNGLENYVQYLAPDAVYSLFDYSYPLHNPMLAWNSLINAAPASAKYKINDLITDTLTGVLGLNRKTDKISLENNGIFLKNPSGMYELDSVGDGYRALVTLTFDILAWQLLAKNYKRILASYESRSQSKKIDPWRAITRLDTLRGIVIIDEIEKHLHPRLQHTIIAQLKKAFPKIQFILATHAPLCVSGTADVEGEFNIYKSEEGEDGSRYITHIEGSPAGLSTDEIFQIYFEKGDTRNQAIRETLEEYRKLYLKERPNKSEKGRMKLLETKLKETTMTFPRDEKKIIRERLDNELETLVRNLNKSS